MRLRSLLFVPGDRPERMAKAAGFGADALILDLEDGVAPNAKQAARDAVAAFLSSNRAITTFVRINSLDSGLAEDDLAALLPAPPNGIMLPKADGAVSMRRLDTLLVGDISILPIAAETPAAVFTLGTYGGVTPRLCGLTWGGEDLPTAIGAATAREADGNYTSPYQLARSLTLFGAHAAGVPAIETVYANFRDLDGLAKYAARGRRDGFNGMMAIHPTQVALINAAFTPTFDEVAQAQRVIAAFQDSPDGGALQIDGQMIDTPHLNAAKRLLAMVADTVPVMGGPAA